MSVKLQLKEIRDPYIRENFKRLLKGLDDVGDAGNVTNITNIVNNILSGSAVWTKFTDVVTLSSSKVIDSIVLANFNAVKYIITLYNTAQGESRYFEMVVVNQGGTLKDSVVAKLGSSLNYSINTTVNAGSMELTLFNNEAFNLDVSIGRLIQ